MVPINAHCDAHYLRVICSNVNWILDGDSPSGTIDNVLPIYFDWHVRFDDEYMGLMLIGVDGQPPSGVSNCHLDKSLALSHSQLIISDNI